MAKGFSILIKIECLDYKIALSKLTTGDYFMSYVFWSAMYFDPMSILEDLNTNPSKEFLKLGKPEYIHLLESFHEQADVRFQTLEKQKNFLKRNASYSSIS